MPKYLNQFERQKISGMDLWNPIIENNAHSWINFRKRSGADKTLMVLPIGKNLIALSETMKGCKGLIDLSAVKNLWTRILCSDVPSVDFDISLRKNAPFFGFINVPDADGFRSAQCLLFLT